MGGNEQVKFINQVFLLVALILLLNLVEAQSVWTPTGPIQFPTNASGQINGIGRCTQIKFHPIDSLTMYTTSASGGLYVSHDAGATWQIMGTDFLPDLSCASVCIDPTNDSIIYLGTGDPNYYGTSLGIYKTTNGGQTWTLSNTGLGTRMAIEILIDPNDHNVLIAATNSGIWKSNNGGANWTVKKIGGQFTDMQWKPVANTSTIYASTHDDFFLSNDLGETWTMITNGTAPPGGSGGGIRLAVSPADTNLLYLAFNADEGTILKSTDAGVSFTTVYHQPSQSLTGYDANGGGQGNYNFSLCADPSDPSILYLASHVVWKSFDGGLTWTQLTVWYSGLHTDMHHILFNPYRPMEIWEANDGGVWLSTNGGLAWTPHSNGLNCTEIYHAAQSNTREDLISIGTQDNGELYHSLTTWKCNRGGDWGPSSLFDFSHNNKVYYLNNGNRRGLVPVSSDQSINLPFTANDYTKLAFTPADTNLAYVVKDSIYFTNNLLSTTPIWNFISTIGQRVHAIAVAPFNRNLVYLVRNNSKFIRIENASGNSPNITITTTPSSTSSSASIAVLNSDTNVVYLACNSKIYRSSDRGVNWSNITGNFPTINIISIVVDQQSTDESIYVGCASGVYYRNINSPNWQNYSTGLPTIAQIHDLMIFNEGSGNDKLRVSYYGKGVWEVPLNKSLVPYADFIADRTTLCEGQTVQFSDGSANANTYSWYFQGGNPSSSTATNPLVTYNTPGNYTVSLTVSNTVTQDTKTEQQYITVNGIHALPLAEGFENNFPAGWLNVDAVLDGSMWQLSSNAGGYNNSFNTMLFDNFNYDANGNRDIFSSPRLNFNQLDSVKLVFDIAYSKYNNSYFDSLAVLISTDCGQTYQEVYIKGYDSLSTAPATLNFFIPNSSQWRTDTIDLTAFTNAAEVVIVFENRGHYGNCLYIDNVNLITTTQQSPIASLHALNTISCVGASVQFQDASSGSPTSWQWKFPGGNPSTSSIQYPVVSYASAGVYDVELIVGNANGVDSLLLSSYITITGSTPVTISLSGNLFTTNSSGINFHWYRNNILIPGANTNFILASQSGSYSLTVTDTNGCESISNSLAFVTGLASMNGQNDELILFPNPTSFQLEIMFNNPTESIEHLTVADLSGRIWMEEKAKRNSFQSISVDQLANGVYMLILDTGSKYYRRKFIVNR